MEASNFRNCLGNQKSESTEKGQFGFISVQSFIFRDIRFNCLLYFRQSNQMNTEAWWHQYSYRMFQLTGPPQKVFKIPKSLPKKWKQKCVNRKCEVITVISKRIWDFTSSSWFWGAWEWRWVLVEWMLVVVKHPQGTVSHSLFIHMG